MLGDAKRASGGKTKNVMLLIPSLEVGGSERSAANISRLLSERYNVYVAVFNSGGQVYDWGGQLVDIGQPAGALWKKPLVAIRRVIALRRAVRRHQIDVLFGFTLIGCRYIALAQKSVRRVLCVRGFEETVSLESLYVWLLKRCDSLLFNSYASLHWFTNRNPQLARKMFALQNCFDLDAISQKAKEPTDADFLRFSRQRRVIVSMGRLYDVKGFDVLIQSFLLLLRSMPDAGLLIIGDGPSAPHLKKLAEPGGDSILFAGMKSNPFPYVAASQLYVLPSRAEGFPNALVEAMACGVPVVAANCDTGPNEILNDSFDPFLRVEGPVKARYGMLAPPASTPADDQARLEPAHYHLEQAIREMLTDDTLREKYRQAAIDRARQFSFESSFARYASFLGEA